MRTREHLLLIALAATLALPAAKADDSAPPPPAPLYFVTEVGSAGSSAQAINNAGVVIGNALHSYSPDGAAVYRAFMNNGSGMRDIGTLGGAGSYATAINDAGQVVGTAQTSSGEGRPFLYSGGTMTALGTFGGIASGATAINNSGYVVGFSYPPEDPDPDIDTGPRAVLYPPGDTIRTVGNLPFPNPYSSAADINEDGDIVGYSGPFGPGDAPYYPFLFADGVMNRLDDIGGDFNAATALNDHGQVVGYVSLPNQLYDRHAFLYADGVLTDLDGRTSPSYSIANDINNLGQVVGVSDALGAFLYQGDGLQSLNAMIDPSGGWYLENAHSVNELGQIAVTGRKDGQYYALRLDPVPEPCGVAMALAGLMAIGAISRRNTTASRRSKWAWQG